MVSPHADWHTLSLAEVAARLGTDPRRGLPATESAARLAALGENVLREPPAVPAWRTFLRQFRELVTWILLVAAAVSAVLGDWPDAAAIVAIVLLNAIIGFLQEDRALRALASLERLSAPVARVVREGVVQAAPARRLVPGDRIELEAGDHVPADARLVEAFALMLEESALTGESSTVEKEPGGPLPASTPLGDRCTIVHAGTVVAAGRGAAVVVATGMSTQLGRIAGMLARAEVEPTPLQRRLAELGRMLIGVCVVIAGVILVLELRRGGSLTEILLRTVSLAVAAVPEGLPAVVTLVLAIGLRRMVARSALVRRLPSVETLGSVTVICSDKTGTLTRNEMTVREIVTAADHIRVTGSGYVPRGEFLRAADSSDPGPPLVAAAHPDLQRLLTIAMRCNNATVQPVGDGDGWRVIGDPTEGALVVAAVKAGVAAGQAEEPTVFEIPFDSERKRMSVVVRRRGGGLVVETKGAPEAVLPRCVAEWRNGVVVPLAEDRRREILATAAGLADRALRVLSLAYRDLPPDAILDGRPDRLESALVHVGLVGMIDPPRDEAKRAVRICRAAGIRPVMITGDHPATAIAVGRELGLLDADDGTARHRVLTGGELDALSDEKLVDTVQGIAIYARVSAEHKLRVVRAWQRHGDVVAMTGDGVNDAPAVQAADIGIAMGMTGTDVTREASDMVLTDDNFASIVTAVGEGRGIYDNIQKFVHYLLACNAAEVTLMFVAAAAGWPAPLAAVQLLWLNLVTDGLPALSLGLEPPEPDIMTRPPRPPREPVITRRHGLLIAAHGALVAVVAVGAFWATWHGDDARLPQARAVTFGVAAFSQLFFAIGCRSDRRTAFELGFAGNPGLLAAILLSALLQVSVMTLASATAVLEVGTRLGGDWLLVLGLALLPVTVVEVSKPLLAAVSRRTGRRA